MGTPVMILGASGTGKSASMRNLREPFGLVNVASKPLPFKNSKTNILNTDDYQRISSAMGKATSSVIVIDDAQYLMANAYMRSATMKLDKSGVFDFYKEIGYNFWSLVRMVLALPPEKIVYFLGHTETDEYGKTKFKTIGRLLDDKITVEGMFSIVFRTAVVDGKFYFSTVNDGTDTVKTPIGMFADRLIDNDLAVVDATIREYYGLSAKKTA